MQFAQPFALKTHGKAEETGRRYRLQEASKGNHACFLCFLAEIEVVLIQDDAKADCKAMEGRFNSLRSSAIQPSITD